jgi:acetaldehyde dehydrogenase (acetylating)
VAVGAMCALGATVPIAVAVGKAVECTLFELQAPVARRAATPRVATTLTGVFKGALHSSAGRNRKVARHARGFNGPALVIFDIGRVRYAA